MWILPDELGPPRLALFFALCCLVDGDSPPSASDRHRALTPGGQSI
jgi:hypothetical protein